MKKITILFLFLGSLVYAEGPTFQHKDPFVQQEFENIYQDIRSVLTLNGTSRCIDDPTFCVDTVNNSASMVNNAASIHFEPDTSVDIRYRNASDTGYVSVIYDATQHVFENAGTEVFRTYGNSLGRGGTTAAITFDSSNNGYVNKPSQPSFLVTASANTDNVTGDDTIFTVEFGTETFDLNADFNTGTAIFTAPVGGKYLFSASILSTVDATHEFGQILLVTSNRTYRSEGVADSATRAYLCLSISVIADMDANDVAYIQYYISTGDKTSEIYDSALLNYFSGSLIN